VKISSLNSFNVVIPARIAAHRLPGKVLLDIAGKPMLQHVYEQASASNASSVIIATDDQQVREIAEGFGAKVCMTSSEHRSGTDRIHEVVSQLGLADDEIVVNVQGDEPLIPPSAINQVAANLADHSQAGMSSLCEVISEQEEIENPNSVKVVLDTAGYALYFSRSTIPWQGSASAKNCLRHIGIYAYRVSVLNQFVSWPPSELEVQEKLEQLRALFNGIRIHMELSNDRIPAGVDTEKDLEAVRAYLTGST
jgi:3-deoxy-manno-octulosonate cytidylyltransferase (CMP-KDO synthetase)